MSSNRDKVLIVESETKLARGVARELQDRGFEVFLASDAMDALIAARKFSPDVALINSELEGGGGIVALKSIRCNAFTTNIPVIIIIAPESTANERDYLDAGAQECVVSPLSSEAMQLALQRHALKSLDFTLAPAEAITHPDRLAALRETSLLDTPPEESFDRLTRLASHLLGVGTALLSLVDTDRQFFKSQVGLPQPWATMRQTRLSYSFCQWVVSSREQLVVEDANEHPALRANLAVKDLGVIAYAGVPVKGRGGQVLGSFCAIHSEPRTWSNEDVETLHDLSRVSEVYALLDRAKQGTDTPASNAQTNLEISIHVAGNAITSAARILSRYGTRMDDADRSDLLAIILEQGRHLAQLVPDPHFPCT